MKQGIFIITACCYTDIPIYGAYLNFHEALDFAKTLIFPVDIERWIDNEYQGSVRVNEKDANVEASGE